VRREPVCCGIAKSSPCDEPCSAVMLRILQDSAISSQTRFSRSLGALAAIRLHTTRLVRYSSALDMLPPSPKTRPHRTRTWGRLCFCRFISGEGSKGGSERLSRGTLVQEWNMPELPLSCAVVRRGQRPRRGPKRPVPARIILSQASERLEYYPPACSHFSRCTR
jgi:hypothetical protein